VTSTEIRNLRPVRVTGMPRVVSVWAVTVSAMTTTAAPQGPPACAVETITAAAGAVGGWSVLHYHGTDATGPGRDEPAWVVRLPRPRRPWWSRRRQATRWAGAGSALMFARHLVDRGGGRTMVVKPDGRTVVAVYTSMPAGEGR
jgi:hypothetical protein